MDKEAILMDLIKDTRQAIRGIQARVYNLSITFVVFSFAITAFAWEKVKPMTVPITVFSDAMIVVVLIYLYIRIYGEHKFVRLTLEKQEEVLIRLVDGLSVPSREIVAPVLDFEKKPVFSIIREVNLFLWAAAIIIIKSVLLFVCRSWFSA
jgi:hypothetical protein